MSLTNNLITAFVSEHPEFAPVFASAQMGSVQMTVAVASLAKWFADVTRDQQHWLALGLGPKPVFEADNQLTGSQAMEFATLEAENDLLIEKEDYIETLRVASETVTLLTALPIGKTLAAVLVAPSVISAAAVLIVEYARKEYAAGRMG